MPALVAAIISGLAALFKNRIASWCLMALAAFGIAWTTNEVVIDPAVSTLKGYLNSSFGGGDIGSYAMNWLGLLKFDKACSILIGAYTARATIGAAKAFLVRRSS